MVYHTNIVMYQNIGLIEIYSSYLKYFLYGV